MSKDKLETSESGELEEVELSEDILEQITKESEPAVEKMIRETVQQLFNRANIYMITDLTAENINEFYRLVIIDKLFYQKYAWREKENNPDLFYKFTHLYNIILELAISKGRQGRLEFISILGRLKEEQKEKALFAKVRR